MKKFRHLRKDLGEELQFKVDVEGMPPTFMNGRSSAEILAKLRKIVKQPSMIKSVERYTTHDVKKAYRNKAQGRDMDEAVDASDTGGAEEVSMATGQIKAMRHYLDGIEKRVQSEGDMEEWFQNKLTKANDYLKTLYGYGKGKTNEAVKLGEISQDLAKRYHKKATAPGATKPASDLGHTKDSMRKTHNRVVGSNRAMDRMFGRRKTNEDNVNEISQDLKKRYTDKAKSDYGHQQFSADIAREMGAKDAEKYYRRKQRNRMAGITKANK